MGDLEGGLEKAMKQLKLSAAERKGIRIGKQISSYFMACFDLTKSFCNQGRAMISQYWWSHQDRDKMHWLPWDLMKKPKYARGMGFRDLYAFNIAMLAKQGWRIVHNLESLSGQILRAKYFPDGSIFQARAHASISYTWHSIPELIKKGMIWRVGNGRSVHIWNDPWIPRG
jgi:hypothetical protein